MPRKALIAGLGLIGGSIGMALRVKGWRVAYVDPHVELDDATRAGAADEQREELEVGDDDLVILATSVDVAIEQVQRTRVPLMTSTCSVMQALRDAAMSDNFIAGHPMAGSHEHGLHAARRDLFVGKKWFVERQHPIVDEMIRDCGATTIIVDPRKHDDALAITSHIPQLLSTALAAYAFDRNAEKFAGSGMRDFLRLAQSHPSVWLPVFSANRGAIERHLEEIVNVAQRIVNGDRELFFHALDFFDKLASE